MTAKSEISHLDMLRQGLNTPSKEQRMKLLEDEDTE